MVTSAIVHKRRKKKKALPVEGFPVMFDCQREVHRDHASGCFLGSLICSKNWKYDCRFYTNKSEHRADDSCRIQKHKGVQGTIVSESCSTKDAGSLQQICIKSGSTTQPVSLSTHAALTVQRGQSCLMN